jgi:N-formylglutamate deformylase
MVLMTRYPVLILIPHGGYRIPEEFTDCTSITELDLVMSADAGSNEIFDTQCAAAVLQCSVSRLFTDIDRDPTSFPPKTENGVIKKVTFFGDDVFTEGSFPDYIAITGILKRYYFPAYETIKKVLATGEIKLIIECHTVAAVGPRRAHDRDTPRPLVSVQNICEINGDRVESCTETMASALLASLKKNLSAEPHALHDPFVLSDKPITGKLSGEFSVKIPYMRINLSRSLFLTDEYFNYEFAKFDNLRLTYLKSKIDDAFTRFFSKVING